MPKGQKSSQNSSGPNTKQITDFFPRKSALPQSANPGAACPSVATQRGAKQASTKENATPRLRSSHSKPQQGDESSSNAAMSSGFQRTGASSSLPTRAVHVTSPMQPSTKRLRSQSIVSPQPTKQTKRPKNILCDLTFEEKMDIDDSSALYVQSASSAMLDPSPFLQVPPVEARWSRGSQTSTPPVRISETVSLVPSSLSEERELESGRPEQKDADAVREAVDHWRQQALPSPVTDANSAVEPRTQLQSILDGGSVESAVTPARPITTTTSILTPPSTDGPAGTRPTSPAKLLDAKARTEQIIRNIRARAYARAQEPSSPLSEIASLGSSDEDDEDELPHSLPIPAMFKSSSELPSLIRPTRYNLRKTSVKTEPDKQKTISDPQHNNLPSPPARRKSTLNPLDILLKEKRQVNGGNGTRSADREARLRELAYLNLNDDSEDDNSPKNLKTTKPATKQDEGNPYIDDDQRRQVMEILEGDKALEDEEVHLRLLEKADVELWDILEPCDMKLCEDALPPIEYSGPDPVLRMLFQAVTNGDFLLVHVVLESGALELANYTDGGKVIGYLTDLALSHRDDHLDFSAYQLLSNVMHNPTIVGLILPFHRILFALRALGAQLSVLEKLGWAVSNEPRHGISSSERILVVERLVLLVMEAAKVCRLRQREIPDIVTVLLLVGMEPSVSRETRLQVSQAIHQVCQSVGEGGNVEAEVECAICNKVLCLIQPYTLRNKLHTLDFLASASGRTGRIARSVAHSMLTDKSALLPSQYSALPPLLDLMATLGVSSTDSLHPAGKFAIHEATNYIDMASWTCILAVALTDIPWYMEVEESNKSAIPPSKSPPKEKEQPLIYSLYEKLYEIHGRIQDNRAAHLDRSRTKTILFQTAFRLLYQSQAVAQYRRKNNQNIQSYFRRT